MPVPRPLLIPGLPRAWRGTHTLQLGSVLVDLPRPQAVPLLDLMDGTRTERALLRHAARDGLPASEAQALLDTLSAAGLVLPATALLPHTLADADRRRLLGEATALAHLGIAQPARNLRRRAESSVLITGEGRLAAGLAVALAESGVGHVRLELPGAVTAAELPGGPLLADDIGRPRDEAVVAALRRAAPRIETSAVRGNAVNLQIQLRFREPVALLAAGLAGRRRPHLAIRIRCGVAVVGPFVPAAGGPCLHCVDLHRRDRDPGYTEPVATFEPATVATVLAATAYATAEALTFLDGGLPETLGAAVEITDPGRHRRKSWSPHPACECSTQAQVIR